ncbi:MAG TPA: sulfatase-like hydrolase/transferase [Candidatus Aquilonibacter sp.]|nr:sulfatase-like hydrolase/transferase [Candidatus Aquilonibacter sp.]
MGRKPPTPAATQTSRREFFKSSAAAIALPALAASESASAEPAAQTRPNSKPNLLLIIADQFRWDFVGAYGLNPMGITPNLDSIAQRGVAFRNCVTNQPLCCPSRSSLFTGQYPSQTGVWKNGFGLRTDATTIAKALRAEGYSTNYIGKWHLAPTVGVPQPFHGFVPLEYRGGFDDLWQASNELELTSHPYEGTIWDGDGTPMPFNGIYRVDYLTQLAVKFLKQPQSKPFFLVVSQLEPHFQNDANAFLPPKEYETKYVNPFAPADLKFFPGDWQAQLPGYYGDCKRIDDCVGTLLDTLKEQNLLDNTIVAFISDHGCHFRTRNTEYKRSSHESSIHIPLLMQGPGFDHSRMIPELVSMVDVCPTLLEAMNVKIPDSVSGHSAMSLVNLSQGRESWRQEVLIQISESMVARALRTPQWTYCVADPTANTSNDPGSAHYDEYQMYDLFADPHQLLNLAGRKDVPSLVHPDGDRALPEIAAGLRERLIARMAEAGEAAPQITPARLYP